MKITIVIPLLNEDSTIGICLDAILAQIEPDDDIIVVDNGSEDNSVQIVKQYSNVTLFESPNKTVSELRNEGASAANGDIIAFIDADCIICERWRDNLVDTFKDNTISATGSKVSLPVNAKWLEKVWYSQTRKKWGYVNYINSGNFAVRHDVFLCIGGFNENLISGEDAEICARMNKNGFFVIENPAIKAIHLGNPKTLVAFYRQQLWHGKGALGTFRLSIFDKPLLMTILFSVCLVLAIYLTTQISYNKSSFYMIPSIVIILLIVPTFTAIYRILCYRNIKYLVPLIFLYFLYYLARFQSLFHLFWINRTKSAAEVVPKKRTVC